MPLLVKARIWHRANLHHTRHLPLLSMFWDVVEKSSCLRQGINVLDAVGGGWRAAPAI